MSFERGWKARRNAALARKVGRGGKVARYRECSMEEDRRTNIARALSLVQGELKVLLDRRAHLESEMERHRAALRRGEKVSGFNPLVLEMEALAPRIIAATKAIKPAEAVYHAEMKLSDERKAAMAIRHAAEIAAETEAEVAAEAAIDAVMAKSA